MRSTDTLGPEVLHDGLTSLAFSPSADARPSDHTGPVNSEKDESHGRLDLVATRLCG